MQWYVQLDEVVQFIDGHDGEFFASPWSYSEYAAFLLKHSAKGRCRPSKKAVLKHDRNLRNLPVFVRWRTAPELAAARAAGIAA